MNNRRGRLGRARIDIDYDNWFEYRANVDYVMTETGLIDPDRPVKTTVPSAPDAPTGDYRYNDAQPATTNSIEEQRRRVLEEQQKLKDLEEKNKKDSIRGSSKKESMDDKDGDVAGAPVFSLIQIFN